MTSKKPTPEEIVERLRALNAQANDNDKPTIFKAAADLIEELHKQKPQTDKDRFISNR